MTLTLQTVSGSVAGTAYTPAASGDSFILAEGVTFGSSGARFTDSSLDGVSLTFLGSAFALASGVRLGGDNASILIGESGRFVSQDDIYGNAALYLAGENGTLVNNGEVLAHFAIGVLATAVGDTITNNGTIAAASPVFLGLYGSGTESVFTNTGTLSANDSQDDLINTRYNNGVMSEGGATHITNLATGVIVASGDEGAGIRLRQDTDGSTVSNHGEILSRLWYGIDYSQMDAGLATQTLNTGRIEGGTGAFIGSSGSDTLTNSGLMVGDVDLGEGNDVYDGRGGVVEGHVAGGAGDDLYIVDGRGTVLLEALAEGTDRVQSSGNFALGDYFENLTLIGEGDTTGRGNILPNDLIGNAGDNRLFGYEGADFMSGKRGDDLMRGGRDNDSLIGARGGDVLFGGHGDDTLDGGNGRDVLVGGLGADTLTGGNGADLFVFDRKAQSTRAEFDTITDFEQGIDRIDLSDVIEPRFKLVAGGFSGHRPEIKLKEVGADTHILITVDANRSVDMRIDVTGVTGLHADDFIL